MDEWINDNEIVRVATDDEIKRIQEKHGHKDHSRAASSSTNNADGAGTTAEDPAAGGTRTRGLKRKASMDPVLPEKTATHAHARPEDDDDEFAAPDEHDEHEGMDAASIREHEEVTKVKNVRFVELGRYRMAAWYFSPFPKEFFPDGQIDCLYFCEFCMSFFCHKRELLYHQERRSCLRHPPGNEIYRHENLSVFEVDGAVSKIYGQNLCYFAKLFLDHKTLYYDVDPFLFYVVCEVDTRGFHPVGYFSKEKYSELGYNLACILTFPCHQRKGYGNFIIQFSYELSKKEEKVGSPEKPLSDLGLVSYRSYWTKELLRILRDYPEREVSIMELTRLTSIKNEDIISTLQYLNMIKYFNGQYVFVVPKQILDEQLNKVTKKGPQVVPEKLHWAPLQLDIKRDKWSLKSKSADKED
ncbi:hypothetical protein PINS_up007172 [Pythium insidiosum]|nr:hypothetical protein PINS_up007172 [Pythium insidiosum]